MHRGMNRRRVNAAPGLDQPGHDLMIAEAQAVADMLLRLACV
jgi:hypothetical protein